jgi:hypothetical protein
MRFAPSTMVFAERHCLARVVRSRFLEDRAREVGGAFVSSMTVVAARP